MEWSLDIYTQKLFLSALRRQLCHILSSVVCLIFPLSTSQDAIKNNNNKKPTHIWEVKVWKWVLVAQWCVQLFDTPWTVAHQAPLSMGFPRQAYGVSSHSLLQEIFLTYGLSPALQADSLPSEPTGEPTSHYLLLFRAARFRRIFKRMD